MFPKLPTIAVVWIIERDISFPRGYSLPCEMFDKEVRNTSISKILARKDPRIPG